MAVIVTRAGKGSALTFNEVDDNFTNLNSDGVSNASSISALSSSIANKLTKTGDTMSGALSLDSKLIQTPVVNTQTGADITINPVSAGYIALTGVGLTSVIGLKADTVVAGEVVRIQNLTGGPVSFKNRSVSAISGDRIYTINGAGRTSVSNVYTETVLLNGEQAIFVRDQADFWTMFQTQASPVFSVGFKTSGQTITASTSTAITFGSLQNNSLVAFASPTYTAQADGTYRLSCQCDYGTNSSGTYRYLSVFVDPGTGYVEAIRARRAPTAANVINIDQPLFLNAGDKVQFRAEHDASISIAVGTPPSAGVYNTFFCVEKMS